LALCSACLRARARSPSATTATHGGRFSGSSGGRAELIGLLIFLFVRRGRHGSSAKAVLAERYARGEINADEYRERLANLK
jgi:Short C-terminal domain